MSSTQPGRPRGAADRPSGPGRRRPSRPAGSRVADPAREAALEAAAALDDRDAYVNLVLPAVLRRRGLHGRDAAFATELTYGSVRGRGSYDAIIAAAAGRPVTEITPALLVEALRLGAHQLLAMRVPRHAAVSATVDLVATAVGAGPARMANAVLRRIAEHDFEAWMAEVAPNADDDPDGQLAVTTSHPEWVVRALRDSLTAHGAAADELPALLAADNIAPEVSLAVLPGLGDAEALRAVGARPGALSPLAMRASGAPDAFPGVPQGHVRVQDEGSQVAALLLADADLVGQDGGRWLDLCAGPGGKAALLSALQGRRTAEGTLGERAHLDAVEVTAHRARLVEAALRPMRSGTWTVHVGDGRAVAADLAAGLPGGGFDRVLLDAPCSGLGALRRRPEARWRRTPGDVADLSRLQRELLRAALAAVRPGGVVAYVTCSPHRAETLLVVDDVLKARGGKTVPVERLDAVAAAAELTGMPVSGIGPTLQLWPHRHGCDAMFVALLRRLPTAEPTETLRNVGAGRQAH